MNSELSTFTPKLKMMLIMDTPPIYQQNKQNKHSVFYYYVLRAICGRFSSTLPPMDFTPYYLYTLKDMWKLWNEAMVQYLSDLTVPDKAVRSFIKNLVSFANQMPALFQALAPRVKYLIEKIGLKTVTNMLEFQCLDIVLEFDASFLGIFQNNWITNTNMDKFWQYPSVLITTSFSEPLQRVLAAREPFPVASSLFKESNMLTLVNDCINRKRNFVDFIFKMAHSVLVAKDFGNLKEILDALPELKHWIFLVDYDEIVPDETFCDSVMQYYEDGGEWPLNVKERMRNDRMLMTFVKQAGGELGEESVPKAIQDSIMNVDMSNINFFADASFIYWSDEVRKHDCAFFFAYRAISLVMDCLEGREFSEDLLIFYIDNSINSHDLILDIFSLIFLKKDGKFVFGFDAAEQVLTALLPYSKDKPEFQFISKGFGKIQRLKLLEGSTLNDCFTSNVSSFLTAMDNKAWDVAECMYPDGSPFTKICQLARSVHAFVSGEEVTESPEILLEAAVSTQNGIDDVRVSDETVKKLISRRATISKDEIMDMVEVDLWLVNMLGTMDQKVKNGYEVEIDDKYVRLREFTEYLSEYSRAIHHKGSDTCNIVDELVKMSKFTSWSDLEQLLGPNALELVLNKCDLSNPDDRVINLIDQVCEPVARVIRYSKTLSSKTESVDEIRCIVGDEVMNLVKTEQDPIKAILEKVTLPEDALFGLMDLSLEESGVLRHKELFVKAIFAMDEIPVDFTIEMRLYADDLLIGQKQVIKQRTTANQFYQIFPEDVNRFTDLFIDHNLVVGQNEVNIRKLVENESLAEAIQLASEFAMTETFVDALAEKVLVLSKKEGAIAKLFEKDKSFARAVYDKLPEHARTAQIKYELLGIVEETAKVESDEEIFAGADLTSLASIISFLRNDYNRLQNKSTFKEIIHKKVVDFLYTLRIDTPTAERRALVQVQKMVKICNILDMSVPKIAWIFSFVEAALHTRFRHKYSLENSLDDPSRLVNLCWLCDEHCLAKSARNGWSRITISEGLLHASNCCFMLGQTSSAHAFIDEQMNEQSKVSDLTETMRILVSLSPIDIRVNPHIFHVEMTPMHYKIDCIIRGNLAFANKENFSVIDKVIRSFGGVLELIKMKTTSGDFKAVFSLIERQLTVDEWINYVLAPAVGNKYLTHLFKFIVRNTNAMEKFQPAISGLCESFTEKGAVYTLFEVQQQFNMREDAILSGSSMSVMHESWAVYHEYAGRLEDLIRAEINERKNGKRALKVSDKTLDLMVVRAQIMKEFSKNAKICQLDFDRSQNLLQSDKAIEAMAFVALYTHNFGLALKICDLKSNSIQSVCEKLVDTLNCAGTGATEKFIQAMGKSISGFEYEKIASYMTVAYESRMKRKSQLPKFIKSNIEGNDLQVKLLLKFGFLADAKQTCQNKQLLVLILSAAMEANDVKLANECRRAMASK